MTSAARSLIARLVEPHLASDALGWLGGAVEEIAGGVDDGRFCALLSTASRHAGGTVKVDPDAAALAEAEQVLEGWNPERWTALSALRALLVLAREDLARESGARAVEEAFRYADEGELVALYAVLALLPEPGRFAWRAGEGCRTNMRSVFEAVACDTPYPLRYFDDVAWNQCLIKCVFVEAPLWRVYGVDERLSPELARMALDLADERRSAARPVQHELWMCLGSHGGERGRASLERELAEGPVLGRSAAALGLARAGEAAKLRGFLDRERDEVVRDHLLRALDGAHDQRSFGALSRIPAARA